MLVVLVTKKLTVFTAVGPVVLSPAQDAANARSMIIDACVMACHIKLAIIPPSIVVRACRIGKQETARAPPELAFASTDDGRQLWNHPGTACLEIT